MMVAVTERLRIEDIAAVPAPLTRAEKFRLGHLTAADLDDEEILHGVIRNDDGTLPKRRTVNVPRELHDEFKRRFFKRAEELLQEGLFPAIRYMNNLVNDEDAADRDRLAASRDILNRVLGSEVTVKIKPADPVEDLFRSILGDDDGLEAAETTISGEVVTDE